MRLPYFLAALCFFNFVLGSAVSLRIRALNDVFDGFDTPLPLQTHAEDHTPDRGPPPAYPLSRPAATLPLMAIPTSLYPKPKESSTLSHQQTTTSTAGATHSLVESIPPLPSVTPASTRFPTSASQGGSRGTQDWKVVGVAVIAFTTVAAILLLSVFFDQWWGFLRDLVWKKKHKEGTEELIPDWEKADWDMRLGGDRHRYPTIPPPAATKQAQFNLDNVAGVGSGFNTENRCDATPRSDNRLNSPWSRGLGLLTPVPPAAQVGSRRTTGLRRQDSNPFQQPRFSPPSPALTDPYGGIAE